MIQGQRERIVLSKDTKPEAYLHAKRIDFRYNANELQFLCPWCGHDTFSMNAQSGLFRCWRANHCGVTGGLYKLVKHWGDWISSDQGTALEFDAEEAERRRLERVEQLRERAEEKVDSYDVETAHQRFVDAGWVEWTANEWDWAPDVINNLKVGIDTQWFPELGREEACMVFPYFTEHGSLHNVQFRTLPGKQKAMRWLAGGLRTIPFNADALVISPIVVLVEGAKDAITLQSVLARAGLDWMDYAAVGIPGAGSHRSEWLELLSQPDKRILLFDNDQAGVEGAMKFRRAYPTLEWYQTLLPEDTTAKDVSEYVEQGGSHQALLEMLRIAVNPLAVQR
jgi:hypothetical protein